MVADAIGNLWVMDYYRPGEYQNNWSVFSREGVWQGTVALPDHFFPTQIGEDFLLGEIMDELNFYHIVRYRLNKPPVRVVLPDRTTLEVASETHIWTLESDELDVQCIVRYRVFQKE